jgi:hypothetical protein
MNNTLKEDLITFKNITLSIIQELEREEYDRLEGLIEKREEIMNSIKGLSYNSAEFKTVCDGLQLMQLEQKATKLLTDKKTKIRADMDTVKVAKKANNNYQKKFQPDSLFFNKKI